jgi:hypothetical protein
LDNQIAETRAKIEILQSAQTILGCERQYVPRYSIMINGSNTRQADHTFKGRVALEQRNVNPMLGVSRQSQK